MTAHRAGKKTTVHTGSKLSHLDDQGRASMVDVGDKPDTVREAIAQAVVRMQPATLRQIQSGKVAKGEVLATARLAGIMAAKRTSDLIPLCHPLAIQVVSVDLQATARDQLTIESRVKITGKTGVEMEALVAATTAALTVYDMCKAIDRGMEIASVRLLEKKGGRSGHYIHAGRKPKL